MNKDNAREGKVDYAKASEALNGIKIGKSSYPDDSLALHTDLYQINMAESYWDDNLHNRRSVFEAYFRKAPFGGSYVVFAGLERVIDYIVNFRFSGSDIDYLKNELGFEDDFLDYLKTIRFDGNIKSVVEGEVIFPNEPMVVVDAKLAQAQLIETPLLNILNFHPLIATKAARIRSAVGKNAYLGNMDADESKNLMEFGTRRAHEFDAALYGTRAAYIGGFNSTSNVRAGKLFGIPVVGTHSHSMVQVYGDEYTAFKKFAKRYKNCVFLVDTYDTLKSGVPNAIKVANELGGKINFIGIRLDSGNMAKLSQESRKMLDKAGYKEAKVFASSDLDEYTIVELTRDGAKIDSYGVGTKLITAFDQPALGAVYKLVSLEDDEGNMIDSIKLSETPEKTTTPGMKKIYRIFDTLNRRFESDQIAMENEGPDVNPNRKNIAVWDGAAFTEKVDFNASNSFRTSEIHRYIFKSGKLVYEQPTLEQMRAYCMSNLAMLRNSFKSLNKPEPYPVRLSQKCIENKSNLIKKASERVIF